MKNESEPIGVEIKIEEGTRPDPLIDIEHALNVAGYEVDWDLSEGRGEIRWKNKRDD